jgi:site-specific recombinase XerD
MKWGYWISLYIRTHCTARGLRTASIVAYDATLKQFREYVEGTLEAKPPDATTASDILGYLQHLREVKGNGDSAVNRTVTVLRSFYRAMVAMGHLDPRCNPMMGFPTIRGVARKLPTALTLEETEQLLSQPPCDTVIGVRDRTVLALLYGTGIRASECAGLSQRDVDLRARTIFVTGKGGHQRVIPLNEGVVNALSHYLRVRGAALPSAPFFISRLGRAMSRGTIYERVRRNARLARIPKLVSPHRLRHTFATHLLRAGENIEVIRDLLGHRLITSTQIYMHVTAQDLRAAADRHPIARLLGTIAHLLPDVKLPFQQRRFLRRSG